MGKRKKKSGVSSKEYEGKSVDIDEPRFTVSDLLKKVDEYVGNFDFEMAERFCTRALKMCPDNLQALDAIVAIYLEIGKNDEAVPCLKRAIEIEPNKGFSKYMTLGELLEGEDAVECLKKGIELMINEKETVEKESESQSVDAKNDVEMITERDISNAFCSLAEIYLTDCCFAEDAETSCKFYCEKAIEHDENNPDAYQVMANFLLSEQKNEEARDVLLKGMNLWHTIDDPVLKRSQVPSYESRISLSKMLIELEEFDLSANVLGELLSEDDEVVQVWYLLGWIQYLKQQDYASVVYYLEMAQKLFSQTGCDDEPLSEHITELLSEAKEKLSNEEERIDENGGENEIDDNDMEESDSMNTTE